VKKLALVLMIVCFVVTLVGKSTEDWISEAKEFEAKDIDKAIDIMEDAYDEYEKDIDILSYYGLVLSKGAGQANMLRAAMLSSKAEKMLDKALKIDEKHVEARLYRGILKVNVPKFLGKLDDGIDDLELVMKTAGIPNAIYTVATFYLGVGYEKNEQMEQALECYKNVVRYGSDSEYYKYSQDKVEVLSKGMTTSDNEESNTDFSVEGDKLMNKGDNVGAYKAYTKAVEKDTTSTELYLKYLKSMENIANQGYTDEVYEDVAFMSDLAFNVADAFRHIVRLNPTSDEFRLMKAGTLVHLPFFCNCTAEGVEEAEWVAQNSKTRANVHQANEIVKLGKLKLKKRSLTDKYVNSEDEKIKQNLIKQMMTSTSEQAEPEGVFTTINIDLGFGDYIAPQTAVWIEDADGKYVATVYISGFSAKVKEKQVHLSTWAKQSKFEDSIVKVTGASVDSGKHVFYWNNQNAEGKVLTKGKYLVCAEVSHWPHSGYSLQKTELILGKRSFEAKTKGDNIIAGMKVSY
jgi:tetratricopeptide (TPR) repeat protein